MKQLTLMLFLALGLAGYVWAQAVGGSDAVSVEVLAKASSSWDGSGLPAYEQGRPQITILKFTIPPKARLAMHKHPVISAAVFLKGELTVVKEDGKTLHVKTGDSIVGLVDQWHYASNKGEEPAEAIVFYAGVEDVQTMVKKAESP